MVPEHPGGRAAATGPQAGPAKMEKMEKMIVRMEKFLVKVQKIIVYSWQDWSCYLEAFRRDTRNVHYVAYSAPKCDFRAENVAE